MAITLQNVPGVRRHELDLSDVLVTRTGNTVGTVIRSAKGPVKRPVVVTSEKDFIRTFGAPVLTAAAENETSSDPQVPTVLIPDYGYGHYTVLKCLEETSSVVVVRATSTDDKYSVGGAEFKTLSSSAFAMSATPVAAVSVKPYVIGDPYDSPTYMSDIDDEDVVIGNANIVLSSTSPGKPETEIAYTVETVSLSADWLYKYDGFPTEAGSLGEQYDRAVLGATAYYNGIVTSTTATITAATTKITDTTNDLSTYGAKLPLFGTVIGSTPNVALSATSLSATALSTEASVADWKKKTVREAHVFYLGKIQVATVDLYSATAVKIRAETEKAAAQAAIAAGSTADVTTDFKIAKDVVKVTVYKCPSKNGWDSTYKNNDDKLKGRLRIEPTEIFYGSFDKDLIDSSGNSLYLVDVINGNSKNVYAKVVSVSLDGYRSTSTISYKPCVVSNSTNGTYVDKAALIPIVGGSYEVANGISGGIDADDWNVFKSRKNVAVDLLVQPSWVTSQKHAAASVASDRLDCFVEIQSNHPKLYKPSDIVEAEEFGYIAPSYVGLTCGFSRVFDPYTSKNIWLPNAIFAAQVDLRNLRNNKPWTAPAGIARGIISVDRQIKIYEEVEMDILMGRNINCFSYEVGYGFVLWSQYTAQLKKSALDRKNVRFNLNHIENNIEPMLRQFVFENNTRQTRLRIFTLMDDFLGGIKGAGGLYAYQVVCDETNNPPSIIDTNQLNVDCYLQCTKTAEVINFNTIVTRTGASFNTVKLTY